MSFPTVDNVYTQGSPSSNEIVYIDPYLYLSSFGTYPTWNPKIHKINPITYEKIDEWTAPAGSCLSHSMCTDCESLYIGTSSCPSPYRPIHVYKVNPNTMATVASWTSPIRCGQQWAEAMIWDSNSNRLLVLEDGYGCGVYRIWKLTQELAVDTFKDADEAWPPWQSDGIDITILGDYCFISTGGTPGQIAKRRLDDLSLVDYFEGSTDDPDEYIEGLFFGICNDGENLFVPTYDYHPEDRPARLIKVNPTNMTRTGTYYGAADEVLGYGCYAYGGKIYLLLYGWNGLYNPDGLYGEAIIQIDPATMTRTSRHVLWNDEWNLFYHAVGDGTRLHVAGWGNASRAILQFAESGAELCAPTCGIVALGDKVMLCPIGTCYGDNVALKSGKADVSHKAFIALLNNQDASKLAFRNCKSALGDKVVCTPVGKLRKSLLALR